MPRRGGRVGRPRSRGNIEPSTCGRNFFTGAMVADELSSNAQKEDIGGVARTSRTSRARSGSPAIEFQTTVSSDPVIHIAQSAGDLTTSIQQGDGSTVCQGVGGQLGGPTVLGGPESGVTLHDDGMVGNASSLGPLLDPEVVVETSVLTEKDLVGEDSSEAVVEFGDRGGSLPVAMLSSSDEEDRLSADPNFECPQSPSSRTSVCTLSDTEPDGEPGNVNETPIPPLRRTRRPLCFKEGSLVYSMFERAARGTQSTGGGAGAGPETPGLAPQLTQGGLADYEHPVVARHKRRTHGPPSTPSTPPTPERPILHDSPSDLTLRSAVWAFFSIDPHEASIAICTLCGRRVSRGRKGTRNWGTSGQRAHLMRAHKREWERKNAGPTSSTFVSSASQSPAGGIPATRGTGIEKVMCGFAAGSETGGGLRQITFPKAFEGVCKWHKQHPKVQELNRKAAIMIAVDLLPFSFVDNVGFRNLIAAVAPRWKIPSRHYFSRNAVPQLYKQLVQAVGLDLDKCMGTRVHITTDMWTSGQSTDYMTVTAHWVCFQSSGALSHLLHKQGPATLHRQATLCLQTFEKKAHTGEEIWHKLKGVIQEWFTPRKIKPGFVCADNGSNIIAALKIGRLKHVPCLAHVLHLVVTGFLKKSVEVSDMLVVARHICAHFSRSYTARNALQKLQEQEKLPQHNLILEVATRWNSTLHMLQRLYEQRRAVMEYCITRPRAIDNHSLTPAQWRMVGNLCVLLRPFNEATLLVSRADTCLSATLPLLGLIEKNVISMAGNTEPGEGIQHEEDQCSSERMGLARGLLNSLRQHKRVVSLKDDEDCLLATFLDPRFKGTMYHFMFGLSPRDALGKCRQWLEERVEMYLEEEEEQREQGRRDAPTVATIQQLPMPEAGLSSSVATGGANIKKSFWEELLTHGLLSVMGDSEDNPTLCRDRGPSAQEIVAAYTEDGYFGKSEEDSLMYWQSKAQVWPVLVKVAVDLLSCPAASVLSERVFSAAGAIVSDRRTCLSTSNVERLTFIKMNQHLIPAHFSMHVEGEMGAGEGFSGGTGGVGQGAECTETVQQEDSEDDEGNYVH